MDRGEEHRRNLKESTKNAKDGSDDYQNPPPPSSQPQLPLSPIAPKPLCGFKAPDPKDPSKLADIYRSPNNPRP